MSYIDNILIKDCKNLSTIKLADFGLSAQFRAASSRTFEKLCGTLTYMAPEMLADDN